MTSPPAIRLPHPALPPRFTRPAGYDKRAAMLEMLTMALRDQHEIDRHMADFDERNGL